MQDNFTLFNMPKADAPIAASAPPVETPKSAEPQKEPPKASPPKESPMTKAERIARAIETLQLRLASGELDDVRTKVAFVLNQYPDCRNSDVELVIRYWKMFHPEDVGRESITYDSMRSITKMNSIIRARATIQNTFKLFQADEAVAEFREDKEQKTRRRQRAAKSTQHVVEIFCDESGKTDKHYVVGSVWINDVDNQLLTLFQRLNTWRKSIDFTSEIHFTQVTQQRKDDYVQFVREALKASEYIGFKALVLAKDDVRKRPTDESIFKMYHRLIVDGTRHEIDTGRFVLPRSIVLIKDEDEGADKLHLLSLRDNLRSDCPKQFNGDLRIAGVTALKSSTSVLMQLADVFTGSVNRIVNRAPDAARNHKDFVAEGVLKLMGLDPRDIEKDVQRDFCSIIRL